MCCIVIMVLILDGSSEHVVHIWCKSGISIYEGIWLHRVVKSDFFSGQTYFTLYERNIFELPCHISAMFLLKKVKYPSVTLRSKQLTFLCEHRTENIHCRFFLRTSKIIITVNRSAFKETLYGGMFDWILPPPHLPVPTFLKRTKKDLAAEVFI